MASRKKGGKKESAAAVRPELVLNTGKRYAITGETERYYLCGETQFRKNNPRIARIEHVADAVFEEVPEEKPETEAGEET